MHLTAGEPSSSWPLRRLLHEALILAAADSGGNIALWVT